MSVFRSLITPFALRSSVVLLPFDFGSGGSVKGSCAFSFSYDFRCRINDILQ